MGLLLNVLGIPGAVSGLLGVAAVLLDGLREGGLGAQGSMGVL